MARSQDKLQPRQTAGYRKLKTGDLVLVRDFQQAKDKGGKLEPHWSTPSIVDRMSASGISAHIRQLHNPPSITKWFYIDDLILYIPRSDNYPLLSTGAPTGLGGGVHYERGTMGDIGGAEQEGQRGYDMTDI